MVFSSQLNVNNVIIIWLQVYYLASVRLKALCKMLNLGEAEVQKIWTNLEHSIAHHARTLLMDRHLDQLIMCAIYVICKVTIFCLQHLKLCDKNYCTHLCFFTMVDVILLNRNKLIRFNIVTCSVQKEKDKKK